MNGMIGAISNLQMEATGEKIAIEVLAKQLEQQKQSAQGLVQLIQAAGVAGGGRIDVTV